MHDMNAAMTDETPRTNYFHPILRFFGYLISYLFHPLFINSYVMGFMLFFHPSAFVGMENSMKVLRIIHVSVFDALFPASTPFILWRLPFITSIPLRTTKNNN